MELKDIISWKNVDELPMDNPFYKKVLILSEVDLVEAHRYMYLQIIGKYSLMKETLEKNSFMTRKRNSTTNTMPTVDLVRERYHLIKLKGGCLQTN